MKNLFQMVVLASALASSITVFAQSNQPVTRAQVRAELIEIEKAGYNPSRGEDPYYPADVQAAEAKLSAQRAATAVGGSSDGTSATGSPAASK